MKKLIGDIAFFVAGWKLVNGIDIAKINKAVVICAPHTSNWDFYYAVFAFWKMGIPMKMFIKDSWTKPWYGFVIKWLGGIGIDRSARNNMTGFATEYLKNHEHLYLLNTPEGTRSWSEKWKNGFYYIAKDANVPLLLAFCDYKRKEAGIDKIIHLENRSKEDVLDEIQAYYANINAKYPENYNKKIY